MFCAAYTNGYRISLVRGHVQFRIRHMTTTASAVVAPSASTKETHEHLINALRTGPYSGRCEYLCHDLLVSAAAAANLIEYHYIYPLKIKIFAVKFVVGALLQVNVNVPVPCDEQKTPAFPHASCDTGAGDTTISSVAVIPEILTVCELLAHPEDVSATVDDVCLPSAPRFARACSAVAAPVPPLPTGTTGSRAASSVPALMSVALCVCSLGGIVAGKSVIALTVCVWLDAAAPRFVLA